MRTLITALTVTLLQLLSLQHGALAYLPKAHEDCDRWASVDNECVNNPSFMWSSCLGSCNDFANNMDEKCPQWSSEGECTNNPRYVQLHCPESCQKALTWNPWARKAVRIADAPIDQAAAMGATEEPCSGLSVDLFGAAYIVKMRIDRFMAGQYQHVRGMSTTAPTEFNGLLGVAEACLYALRLYEVLILRGADSDAHAEQLSSAVMKSIMEISDVLSRGWSSDPLQLNLPRWAVMVDDVHNIALGVLRSIASRNGLANFDFCRPVGTPAMESASDYFLGENPDNYPPAAVELVGPLDPASAVKGFTLSEYRTLSNGVKMPLMGLGTWQMQGEQVVEAVTHAIKIGYRHIDAAQAYGNEADIGMAVESAINAGMVKREDLFIASKLSNPADAGAENVRNLVFKQLKELRTPYLDLYMLHSPLSTDRIQGDTWHALEGLVQDGYIRALGVSNFNQVELQKLVESGISIKPMVVQNKVDPYHVGKQLDNHGDKVVEYARSQGIVVVAYSTLSSYPFTMSPLEDPIIKFIAARHSFNQKQKLHNGQLEWLSADGSIADSVAAGATHAATTTAQVLLRWALQKGFAVIPRSSDPGRLAANYQAMLMDPLSPQDMDLIDTLQLIVSSPVSYPVNV